jgi:hypothetical protein
MDLQVEERNLYVRTSKGPQHEQPTTDYEANKGGLPNHSQPLETLISGRWAEDKSFGLHRAWTGDGPCRTFAQNDHT